mgnify:FL=1
MKIQTECVPCLIKRIIFEADQSTDDNKIKTKTIKKACKALSELYDPNSCSASIATKVHKLVYETLSDDDPYIDLKNKANKYAKKLVPKIEEIVKKSKSPLKTSMVASIVGNMMDFGIAGASKDPSNLVEIFEKTINEKLGIDDFDKLDKILSKSKKVLFFTDNCGEIVFDKILVKELKNKYPDIFLTLVVKGESVLSDATMEDAIDLGLDEIVDEILTTGCFAVGVDFNKMPEQLKNALDETDLIICKGMANYESFSETNYKPISYLMRVKCSAIARSIGVKENTSIIKLFN